MVTIRNAVSGVLANSKSAPDQYPSLENLPIREKPTDSLSPEDVSISLHPLDNSFLVSIQPPLVPLPDSPSYQGHAPVDLVLVIDVSGSMQDSAAMPSAGGIKEHTGLSILDLTKHAARTIIETLNEGDRLGIVTFGFNAKIVQGLTPITPKCKAETLKKIEKLRPDGATNLWHGLLKGRELFQQVDAERGMSDTGKVQAIYMLTDGMPNHMCPQQGYVPKLRPMLEKEKEQGMVPPSIHTFGFGYSLRSGLLQSIAEIGDGNFAFIPDAGMIGTVFTHALANLYSTFAKGAVLNISGPPEVNLRDESSHPTAQASPNALIIPLGNLQYGQSRDIVITAELPPHYDHTWSVGADLTYNFDGKSKIASMSLESQHCLPKQGTRVLPETALYHVCRAKLCTFLSSLFPMKADGEHFAKYSPTGVKSRSGEPGEPTRMGQLRELVAWIQKHSAAGNELVQSLLQDLDGVDPQGQVRIALESNQEFQRWGQHYLPSLLHAHTRQVCNSFKDPGPLRYGIASPVFQRCRKQLDDAFDNLPPPKPSIKPRQGQTHKVIASMHSYNSRYAPCFAAGMMVRLGNNGESGSGQKIKSMPVEDLRPGTQVWTPRGSREVQALVETLHKPAAGSDQAKQGIFEVCRVGELLVTPWHPILFDGKWMFPANLMASDDNRATQESVNSVYSVLLTEDTDVGAHAIEIEGTVAVTLGHGLVKSENGNIRAHPFFGDHAKVRESISQLPVARFGVMRSLGVRKNTRSGLVEGFLGMHVMD